MVVIRQHGESGELFDIESFLAAVDLYAHPDTWQVTVDQCVGDRALEIEQLTAPGLLMSGPEFRAIYRSIYQTIDGTFIGSAGGRRLFELRAVDSSFWEVTGPAAFESYMLATYGAWKRG